MISRLVVLARNARDFEAWCRENGLSSRNRNVIYASRADKLRGLIDAKVIYCPRWSEHPDADRISECARIIEQRSGGDAG